MNLSLYGRALWNSKWIVLVGILAAIVLSVLSVAKISWTGTSVPKLSYRTAEVWQDGATLLVTQKGFPEGRTIFPSAGTIPYADPGRLAYLAYLYAQLATSDPVTSLIDHGRPLTGTIQAVPYQDATGATQPLIQLTATGSTPQAASQLTKDATNAFQSYLESQQSEAAIPGNQRTDVTVIRKLSAPLLAKPRKNTLPITVLLAVLAATFVLALVRENRRRSTASVHEIVAPIERTKAPEHIAVEPAEAAWPYEQSRGHRGSSIS